MESPSPSPEASEDENNDDDDDEDEDDDDDEDASSSSDCEMTNWVTCPLSFVTKKGSSFGYESSHVIKERVSIGDIFVRGSVFVYEGCSKDFLYLFFSLLFRYIVLTLW